MKKKLIAYSLCLAMAVTALSGCGKSSDSDKKTDESQDYTAMTVDEMYDEVLKNVEDYVSIDDYKSITLEVEPVAEVTEGAVEAEISNWLDFYPLAFEGTCVSGDTVNIDYVGTVDGNEFEGGSSEGYDLELGSGTFIDGFEEQVEGMAVGETKDINVTFPEEYSSDEVAGKDAVFSVTLNYINKADGEGTLTDKWVEVVVEKEDVSDQITDLTTDGFKAFVKGLLEDEAQEDYDSNVAQGILDKINEISNYDKVSDSLKNEYIENEREYQESYIYNQYGMELEDYIEAISSDEDTFNGMIEESAIDYMQDVLSLKLIAIKEGIKVTEEEYEEYIQKYADYYGAESVEEFEKEYASEYGTDLFESLLLEKVLESMRAMRDMVTIQEKAQ